MNHRFLNHPFLIHRFISGLYAPTRKLKQLCTG